MAESVETICCSNCKRDILSTNFVIHEVHCQRNIYLCPKCKEPVNHNQKAEHDEGNHVLVFCTSCHSQVEKYLLNKHMSDDCSQRKVKCHICDIEIGAYDISEHENYCGARTEKCLECGEFVMLKYKQLHIDSNHTFIKLSDEPGPSPSWQNGQRTLGNFFPDFQSGVYTATLSHQKKRLGRSDHGTHRGKGSPEFIEKDEKTKELTSPNENQQYPSYQANIDSPRTSYLKDYRRRSSDCISRSRFSKDSEPDEPKRSNGVDGVNADSKGAKRKEHLRRPDRPRQTSDFSSTRPKYSDTLKETKPYIGNSTDEDSSLALAIQLSEDLNRGLNLDNDELIAQAIEQNAAVLSEFSLFDSIDENKVTSYKNLTKNVYTHKKPNKTASKTHLQYYGDDSSDEEFFLYAKPSVKNVDDVSLPCEFCESMYPTCSLVSHQAQCKSNPHMNAPETRKRPLKGEKEKVCRICLRFIPVSQYDSHQILIHSTKK